MKIFQTLNEILNSLKSGSLKLLNQNNIIFINNITMDIINNDKKRSLSKEEVLEVNMILNMSNILYNRTIKNILILDDGVYDILLELYKRYDSNFQVGSEVIEFEEDKIDDGINKSELVPLLKKLDTDKIDKFLFKDTLTKSFPLTREDFRRKLLMKVPKNVQKRKLNQKHDYPELVGSLDKVKFVLNTQAKDMGVYDDSNVKIFERDFLQDHVKLGLIDAKTQFSLVLEEKIDGVSVEASVKGNEIISARQRGDANEDISADVTDVLCNYYFPHAKEVDPNFEFGIKFEAVMTKYDLVKYNYLRGKNYKNGRSAMISIFGSLDGWKYVDLITLIPLASSLSSQENVDRITEIEFLNKYYSKNGYYLRYVVITGNYISNLFQVKGFVEECEYYREFLPYMIDGVVVSYIDQEIIKLLGRKNSINKYSMAIKFTPLKKLTTFLGWDFSIGQNGIVTPIAHYKPVEFYGTIHTKTSCHSLKRFNELQLKLFDVVEIAYTNDVMPYLTKPTNTNNISNPNQVISFITKCPHCGNKLKISKSGKSIVDDNINCPERQKKKIASMMEKLNLKDFSEAYLSKIQKFSLIDLLNITIKDTEILGEVNGHKLLQRVNELKNLNFPDYKFVGALGFSDIAEEKWKLILQKYTIHDILNMNENLLKQNLIAIKGIGPTTVETIIAELDMFREDMIAITSLPNVIISKGKRESKMIRFTGCRDKELEKILIDRGYDASGDKGVTQKTDILLIPFEGYESSKIDKAGENTLIVPLKDFKLNMDKYL